MGKPEGFNESGQEIIELLSGHAKSARIRIVKSFRYISGLSRGRIDWAVHPKYYPRADHNFIDTVQIALEKSRVIKGEIERCSRSGFFLTIDVIYPHFTLEMIPGQPFFFICRVSNTPDRFLAKAALSIGRTFIRIPASKVLVQCHLTRDDIHLPALKEILEEQSEAMFEVLKGAVHMILNEGTAEEKRLYVQAVKKARLLAASATNQHESKHAEVERKAGSTISQYFTNELCSVDITRRAGLLADKAKTPWSSTFKPSRAKWKRSMENPRKWLPRRARSRPRR